MQPSPQYWQSSILPYLDSNMSSMGADRSEAMSWMSSVFWLKTPQMVVCFLLRYSVFMVTHFKSLGSALTARLLAALSEVWLETVMSLSSLPVTSSPSLFQSPQVTFLECLPMVGTFLLFFLQQKFRQPFSLPQASTGWVVDHFIHDIFNFWFQNCSSSRMPVVKGAQRRTVVASSMRMASSSSSLSQSSMTTAPLLGSYFSTSTFPRLSTMQTYLWSVPTARQEESLLQTMQGAWVPLTFWLKENICLLVVMVQIQFKI